MSIEAFNINHAKVLYLRFCAIYDHKFVKPYHDDDFKSLWAHEWCSGLASINTAVIKDALEYCKKNLDWPPSIAEFIKICESYSGVPSLQKTLESAVRRDFNHPVILLAYEKVGHWAMKNDTEKQLQSKFQAAYAEALNQFRENTPTSWKKLESYNETQKQQLPPPEKIPTQQERKGFKERLAEYQQKLEDAKLNCKGIPYKQFDEKKIKPGGRDFDSQLYNQYREYLMSIPEDQTMILPATYVYDRNRFLNAREQPELLRLAGYNPNPQGQDNASQKSSKVAQNAYKHWTGE